MISAALSLAPLATEPELREALDRISDGFVIYSRDWRILYMNRAAERYFGRRREDLLGRVVWEAFPAAVGTEAESSLRRAAERIEPTDLELFAPAMQRRVAFRVFPSEHGVSISFRDVTAERKIADALRASEAQHRALFEHALDGILLTAPTGDILAANEAACRMLGRSEQEIRAEGRSGVVDSTDPRLAPALEERRRTGHVRAELTFVRKDGTKFPGEVCSAVYVDAEGRQRTSMTVRDLTDRKRAEDRLRLIADAGAVLGSTLESDATLRNLTRLVVPRLADLCVVDLVDGGELRRVAASHRDPAWEAALIAAGSPGPLDWKDTGLYKVARTGEAEFMPVVDDAWLRAIARDEAHLAVVRANKPRSSIMVPLTGRAGVIGVLTLATVEEGRVYDPSDLATARAIADRAALAIENARLFEQLLEAKRLRDEVLGIVSHDLRNPLNAILLSARVLARRAATEEASTIIRAVNRADSLIQDLLTVAALEAGSTSLDKGSHALSAIVDEAIDLHRALAHERSIELDASVGPEVGTVQVDRNRILQVLSNLLGNALKFTGPGGRVRVEARASKEAVTVSVADTGPGIAPDELPHVFDRFWQGAKARRAGAGLGLAIAKGFVEAHAGTITVESTLGRGTTFTFTIPCGPA